MALITSNNALGNRVYQLAFDFWRLFRLEWMVAVMMVELALIIHNDVTLLNSLLVIALGVGYSLAYALNNYVDRDHDKLVAKKAKTNFFVEYNVNTTIILSAFTIAVIGLFSIASVFGVRGFVAFLVSMFFSWSYSSKPFRFKTKPGLDLIVHSLFVLTYPYYITLFLIDQSLLRIDYIIIVTCALMSMTVQLEQQIRDYHTDVLTITNFTIVFGKRVAKVLIHVITLSVVGIVVVSFFTHEIPLIILLLSIFTLPLIANKINPYKSKIRSEGLVAWLLILAFLFLNGYFIFLLV